MTSSTLGRRKGLLSREDYLAPPAVPTGQTPKDVLNIIWRKNDVFLDIGSYSIGSFVMVLWPVVLIYIWMGWAMGFESLDVLYWYGFMCFCGFPILMLIYILSRPVPLPVRFNRQRREVCVPFDDGRYWIVPWEQVTAQAVAMDSVGQHGKITQGLLVLGFRNPDPDAPEKERDFSLGFSCGGGETAMSLWECMRSYMEVGADAVPASRLGRRPYAETQVGSIVTSLFRGDILDVLHGLFFITFLGTYWAEKVQNWKLAPPPDLTHPAIIEWSKPLPPEQWVQRTAELEQSIRLQQGELEKAAQVA
ncbi:hypothetical protein HNO86_30145 [Pseudomonas sp. C1C7]|uniref:DUF6708 domain-containing protein n=1 Tax=Pseudomonas sp. C1C7 TaxID=2735272 RepID=UPI0015869B23|nr:DUF6708 domain-containing protein [Pseudomonas sp. C1C7]NUT79309.1 hypothetical protein [Pseudomonas sp. C1C7]